MISLFVRPQALDISKELNTKKKCLGLFRKLSLYPTELRGHLESFIFNLKLRCTIFSAIFHTVSLKITRFHKARPEKDRTSLPHFSASDTPILTTRPQQGFHRGVIMKWFRHYSNAHKGGLLQELYAEFGVNTGHGLYFRFVEYLADKWSKDDPPEFKVLESELRKFLGLSKKKLKTFSELFQKVSENKFEISGDFCEIYFPKLLEIRHRDAFSSGQRPAKKTPNSSGIVREEKELEIDCANAPKNPPSPPKRKRVFETAEDFREAFPIDTVTKGCAEFTEAGFEEMVRKCFEYHNLDEQKIPTTKGEWNKRWFNWCETQRDRLKRTAHRVDFEPPKVVPSV